MGTVEAVTVRAPAKLNLVLRVGDLRPDGYHELITVFHAVGLYDELTARPGDRLSLRLAGQHAGVPADDRNLAARAALALAASAGRPATVDLSLHKSIPVAGGLAGGSADAAAALVACDAMWGLGASAEELHRVAAGLGSDVAFALLGGTAIGTGRGERLQPLPAHAPLHWVLLPASFGLSTPAVYAELDRQRGPTSSADHPIHGLSPDAAGGVAAALSTGDPAAVAAALSNDLEPAARALAPSLRATIDAARAAGALTAVVSGSGPTVAALAGDEEHARAVAADLRAAGYHPIHASGAAPGAAPSA